MAVNQRPDAPNPSQKDQIFAARFLEKGPELKVPDGHYDPEQQVYVRDLDGKPAFVDEFLCTSKGIEITTHHSTNVSGATFSDPDNG
jgi:hypothetical protein